MNTIENYFNDLVDQITNPAKWNQDKFVVFNHEAGTGKSRNTHQILGEMTKVQKYKVLFVQRFIKDNELENAVNSINLHAGRKVAVSYTGEDTRKVKAKELLLERQVVCISHQMYIQVCKGEHKYLVKNREILIIDEYPDLLEKFTITSNEVGQLWAECNKRGVPAIGEWALLLRNLMDQECTSHKLMEFNNFAGKEKKLYVAEVKSAIEKLTDDQSKEYKTILKKSIQLVENGGYLFEGGLHTFDGTCKFTLLKNNIILDANAVFDYRYGLSSRFDIRPKQKKYEYSRDTLYHFEIDTTKKGLKRNNDFIQEALKEIKLDGRNGILFITELAYVEKLKEHVLKFYTHYGHSLPEIEEKLNCKISIDYFGNIIGVNHYREYDTIVLLKTPNYDYLTYVSTFHYYSQAENKTMSNIELFKHEDVEAIRKSSVAGELYQAIKRINRDNNKEAHIYLFTAFKEAVDLVVEQLPNIKYIHIDPSINSTKNRRKYNSTNRNDSSKLEKAKSLLLNAKGKGIEKMKKGELRELLEIKDASGLSLILKKLEAELFMRQHGISRCGQTIWFEDNLKQINTHKPA